MKVILALVVEYDATDWARRYDLPETDAVADFTAAVRRAVADDGIRQVLDTAWPMMRDHLTVHALDGLDGVQRDELLHQLRDARDADQEAALVAEIREHLAAYPQDLCCREPRWVIFRTDEWDNGHFLTGSPATVYFPEGDHVQVDFHGTSVDDLLTDTYGRRGSNAALGVDLPTATLEFDDYGDNVPDRLGIPTNDHADGDGCAIYYSDYVVIRDGVEVPVTQLHDGDRFVDYDGPWLAARVGRDGCDVHVDLQPATQTTTATSSAPMAGTPTT